MAGNILEAEIDNARDYKNINIAHCIIDKDPHKEIIYLCDTFALSRLHYRGHFTGPITVGVFRGKESYVAHAHLTSDEEGCVLEFPKTHGDAFRVQGAHGPEAIDALSIRFLGHA